MALVSGSIAFVGINTAGGPDDWIAFVALDAIPAGTVVYFTDNELTTPTASTFNTGESYTKWVAPAEGVAAGTVVKLTSFDASGGPVANIGTVSALTFPLSANRGLSQTADSVYAYLADSDGTADTPTVHLARINLGNAADGEVPIALAANQQVSFTSGQEGAYYSGSHSGQANFSDFLNVINNPANWTLVTGTTLITSLDATDFSVSAATPVLQSITPINASQAEDSGEGPTHFDFTVTLSAPAVADTFVTLALIGDAGDFTIVPASVTVLAGNTSAVATFGVSADTIFEPDENFTVTASLSGVDKQAVATILNDDDAPSNVIAGIKILDTAASLQGFHDDTTSDGDPVLPATEPPAATNSLSVTRIGSIASGNGVGGAESISFDPESRHAFVTNAAADRIDIIDLSNPTSPADVGDILLGALAGYGEVNSVAVKNGIVAVAIQNIDGGTNGFVRLYDTNGVFITQITVGVQPDQVAFSADGSLLLVANEAERFVDRIVDGTNLTPVIENASGSITIITVQADATLASVRNTIGFTALDGFETELEALGIKINDGTGAPIGNNQMAAPDSTPSQDIEPEYITISPDGTKAYVTLQEVNAVAVIDLLNTSADRPMSMLPLGFVDRNLAGNEGDFSDRDGPGATTSISINTSPLKGLLNPDAIASFKIGGLTYFITANEGDSRIMNDPTLVADPDGFNEARASTVQGGLPADYARVNVDTSVSSSGDLFTFGGRGVSIFRENADGTIEKVRETGGEFEKIIASLPNANTIFNGQDDFAGGNGFDTRSDNKGPEPEGVTIGKFNDHTYAFIALERVGGLMIYDVSNPEDAEFVRYVPATVNDQRPEVVQVISAEDSPNGNMLILTANEQSGTVTVYEVDALKIHDIQGSGQNSPLVGQAVTTRGVVVATDTTGSRGYYIQDPNADADSNTSEGIFVFTGGSGALPVAVGHLVEVRGTVAEFIPNGAALGSLSTTQIVATAAGSVVDLGVSPNAITPTIIGGPGGMLPPTADLTAGANFFESLEGMLVTVTNPIAVGPTNSFGEIYTVVDNDADSSNGANATGLTSRGNLLLSPGSSVFGDNSSQGQGGDFNPERIQIDDDNGVLAGFASPAVNVGALLNSVTGIVNYDFGNYQIIPTQAYGVAQASTLVKETGALVGDANHLTVAAYNAENLDPNDGAGRFTTIAGEIIDKLRSPDIIALQEIQDNNGAVGGLGSTVITADITLGNIVSAIAGAGGPAYAFLDNPFIGDDTNGGEPGGNIRVAFLYRTDRVDFVDGSLRTVAANGDAVNDPAGNTDQLNNPDNPFFTSRPPLAATFIFNGEEITVVNNHFTSKGGSAALFGSDQPPFNAGEVQRAGQAQAVNTFVDNMLASDPDARIVVAGDLNEFPFEEPMQVLKGTATISNYDTPASDPFFATAVYTPGGTQVLHDLLETLPANEQFDYVFEGNSETLDHVFVTGGLQAGAQFDVVRINAEFAVQTSDHEPLVASLFIPAPFTLQLLHLYGETGTIAKDTAPIMGAMIDKFDDQYANTLILAEGDTWIPGPWLVAGADPALNPVPGIGSTALARPDVAIMNAFGVDASALGNHEFDLGSPVVSGAIAASGAWVGAQFPFITANLSFSADGALRGLADASLGGTATNNFAGQEASSIKGKIAPSTVVTMNGEKIGIVGATTYDLLIKTSPNGTAPKDDGNPSTDDLQEVAAYIQSAVDGLRAQGVNKIVMVDQLDTIERNKVLAPLVNGIDIMVAGGGHERMGDANDVAVSFNGHSPTFVPDAYPIVTAGSDGKATLIVTTDTEFSYLGRLVVKFDSNGELILSDLDDTMNGAYASNEATLQSVYGTLDSSKQIIDGSVIGSKVEAIADAIDLIVTAKDGNKFGFSDVYLEGDRVFARAQETNLGDITADANAFKTREAIAGQPFLVSLKNGGGLRSSIGSIDEDGSKIANPIVTGAGGNVSQLDVENALRFDNKLMVFDTSPEGLLRILNYGAGLAPGNGGFPQIGGVKFSFDPDNPLASRVVNVALINEQGELISKVVENGVLLASAPAVISVVALNFTANGGDGYPIKTMTDAGGQFLATNFRYLLADDTLSAPINRSLDFTAPANVPANTLGEQKAFEDYLEAQFVTPDQAYKQADTPASEDMRIENLNVRSDVVFANLAPQITGDLAITIAEGSAEVITTADLNEADPDNSGFVLNYTVTGMLRGKVLLNGADTLHFNQTDLAAGHVSFKHVGPIATAASFTVTLTDAGGLTSGPATVQAAVTPVNDAPVIVSAPSFTVPENRTSVGTVVAVDPEHDAFSFALAGGDDRAFFLIDAHTGALSFLNSPDFETPEDADHDNAYKVIVSATDSISATGTQMISVNITNVNEVGQTINGGNGNDTLTGGAGNDTFDGGAGIDTAIFPTLRSSHAITQTSTGFTVSGGADGTDTLTHIERLQFSDVNVALDINGNAGQVYRLYQAAFDRQPDSAGLGYWINQMDHGTTLEQVASGFINSTEFSNLYGASPTTEQFVSNLYDNVLHRPFDQAGFDYWVNALAGGGSTRDQVLAGFSESAENQANVIGVIGNGIEYTPPINQVTGTSANDTLASTSGNDAFDGGAGLDTAIYQTVRSSHAITKISTGFTVSGGTDGTDTLTHIERLQFSDGNVALDINGNAGQVYRLYQAAFDRQPDTEGLGYWIKQMDHGAKLEQVASGFIYSTEFSNLFGTNPTTDQFVTNLYDNVLHRLPDQEGFDYWVNALSGGGSSRDQVLAGFSESAENQANVIGIIGNGFEYTQWL